MSEAGDTSVLVADDERRYAEAHARMLADEYSVETAYGGEDVLDAVTDDVDVLVIDRNMPTLSGDEVAAEVRDRNIDCRIIMITAVEPDLDIVDLGIDDYLTKPVSADELKGCLEDALEWAEYDDTLRDYFALSNKREVLIEEGSGIEETERFDEIEERLMEAAEQGLQKSEEVLQTLIQSSPAAIVTLDEEGKIDIWNPSAEELFGWEYDKIVGEDPPMFAADEETHVGDIRADLFTDGTVTDYHMKCLTASGTSLDVSLSAAPLYDSDGEMYGTMFVMTDITERKRREQRLSVMSRVLRHNIRNELNVVMGRMEVIKDEIPADKQHHIEEALDTTRGLVTTSRKAQKVQNVLDERKDDIKPRDVQQIVRQAVERGKELYPDVAVSVEIETEKTTALVGDGLVPATWQLVENAIEHNEDPTVLVTLEAESTDEHEWLTVHVEDDGSGINDEEIEVLSQEEEDALKHGSGIGLWTTKWIVERSGGELEFGESELGGTSVRLRLREAPTD